MGSKLNGEKKWRNLFDKREKKGGENNHLLVGKLEEVIEKSKGITPDTQIINFTFFLKKNV